MQALFSLPFNKLAGDILRPYNKSVFYHYAREPGTTMQVTIINVYYITHESLQCAVYIITCLPPLHHVGNYN